MLEEGEMTPKRICPEVGSQAGVWHVFSRIIERDFLLTDVYKDFLVKVMRAYEDLLGVEVLTFA